MADQKSWDYDYLAKLLVVGDSSVGKSCMLLRYAEDDFCDSHMTTIGVDFKLKTKRINGKTAKIQIWDTAGQERFRTITASYYRGAHGVVLVYDVTNEKSFEHIQVWYEEIKEHATDGVSIILVGNKCDLVKERVISKQQGEELAAKFNMKYIETSAKNGEGVEQAFDSIIQQVVDSQNFMTNSVKPQSSNYVFSDPSIAQNSNDKGCAC